MLLLTKRTLTYPQVFGIDSASSHWDKCQKLAWILRACPQYAVQVQLWAGALELDDETCNNSKDFWS